MMVALACKVVEPLGGNTLVDEVVHWDEPEGSGTTGPRLEGKIPPVSFHLLKMQVHLRGENWN